MSLLLLYLCYFQSSEEFLSFKKKKTAIKLTNVMCNNAVYFVHCKYIFPADNLLPAALKINAFTIHL